MALVSLGPPRTVRIYRNSPEGSYSIGQNIGGFANVGYDDTAAPWEDAVEGFRAPAAGPPSPTPPYYSSIANNVENQIRDYVPLSSIATDGVRVYGRVTNAVDLFWNGTSVGYNSTSFDEFADWEFYIPAALLLPGEINLLAIRHKASGADAGSQAARINYTIEAPGFPPSWNFNVRWST